MTNPTVARCLSSLFMSLAMSGCASIPASMQELPWQDAWGDRGVQVRDRDWIMCAELTESRRSLLAGCMAQRGWVLSGKVSPDR